MLTVDAGGEEAVRDLLADVSGLKRSVGFRDPEGGLTCVVGIGVGAVGPAVRRAAPGRPAPVPELAGARHTAVATPAICCSTSARTGSTSASSWPSGSPTGSAGVAQVVDEVHGFRSFDERDLLGFVDGTENPEGAAARDAVLIGDEDPAFAGGSYVIVQKYLHDLAAWDALPVEEQERVIGRTKLSDIELPDDVKPANSHVALNTIVDEDGEERQIVRFNMPFGRVGAREFGTYFIGYARNPDVIEQMLTNMFVGNPPGQLRPDPRLLDGRHRQPVLRARPPTSSTTRRLRRPLLPPRKTMVASTSRSESVSRWRFRVSRLQVVAGRSSASCLTAVVDPGDGEQDDHSRRRTRRGSPRYTSLSGSAAI